jgi:CubicO group peptidase (beta-lactamase class C family)
MFRERALGDLVRDHAERHAIPGAAVGIVRDGMTMFARHGIADVATGEPIEAGTWFAAGSLTKTMVATVIVRLAAVGRLSLEDPVPVHVPEMRAASWAGRATIRDLLANRSGLPMRAELEFGFDRHTQDDDGALSRLATEVAHVEPLGDFWSYSNVGWCLLGRAIEVVTGQTWETAMRRGLFEPVGMRDTTFRSGAGAAPEATGHSIEGGRAKPVAARDARAYGPAGTSVLTTAADLLRFAELHMTDPLLAELRVAHADLAIPGWFDAWCLGQARFDWQGGPVWGWDGMIDGQRSVLRYVPDRRLAVVLLTNASTGRAMSRSLLPELFGSFGIDIPPLDLESRRISAADLDRFSGNYGWPDWDIRIIPGPADLTIETPEARITASPVGPGTFRVDPPDPDSPTATFAAFDAENRPHVFYDSLWGFPRTAT